MEFLHIAWNVDEIQIRIPVSCLYLSYPVYFRERHWLSMGLPEISRVARQVGYFVPLGSKMHGCTGNRFQIIWKSFFAVHFQTNSINVDMGTGRHAVIPCANVMAPFIWAWMSIESVLQKYKNPVVKRYMSTYYRENVVRVSHSRVYILLDKHTWVLIS